jgi:hypothetical protein
MWTPLAVVRAFIVPYPPTPPNRENPVHGVRSGYHGLGSRLMYVNTPELCHTPTDDGAEIWRYMTFPAFVSLLQKQKLFFVKIEELLRSDPFEGRYTAPVATPLVESHRASTALQSWVSEQGYVDAFETATRRMMCVNCWHKNDTESDAMWKLYGADHGIALRSTLGRLKGSFGRVEQPVFIGSVDYVEYQDDPGDQALATAFKKRRSFCHEQELRVAVLCSGWDDSGEAGVYVPVDLDVLIDTVYASPICPSWLQDVIAYEMSVYGIVKPLKRSTLLSPVIE